MKPIKFKKKLIFHKETIADLSSKELKAAYGGIGEPVVSFGVQTECPYTQVETCGTGALLCPIC